MAINNLHMDAAAATGLIQFVQSGLEAFDPQLHAIAPGFTWQGDIALRTDVSIGTEATSYLTEGISGVNAIGNGTQQSDGLSVISANSTSLPTVGVNMNKVSTPVHTFGKEVAYSFVEADRARLLGQSLDTLQAAAVVRAYNSEVQQVAYIGSTAIGLEGLYNSSKGNLVSGSLAWDASTTAGQAAILAAINTFLMAAYDGSGRTLMPDTLVLPADKFASLVTPISGQAVSLLQWIQQQSIAMAYNGRPLRIVARPAAAGIGAGGKDRVIAYSNIPEAVRLPLAPLERMSSYQSGIRILTPYLWALGAPEILIPGSVAYKDFS